MISGEVKLIPILEFLKKDIDVIPHGFGDPGSPGYDHMVSRWSFKRRYTCFHDRIEENKKWINYYEKRKEIKNIVLHKERIKEIELQIQDLENEINKK